MDNHRMLDTTENVRRTLQLDKPRVRPIVRRTLIAVVLLGVIVLGGRAWLRRRAESSRPQYTTQKVERADLRMTVSATGKIQGMNSVEVGAEVTGKVSRVLVDYNDRVTKGQVLAEIDPEQLRADVEEKRARVAASESNIREAEATLAEKTRSHRRAVEQAKLGLISQKDLEVSEADEARAEAKLGSARASAETERASLRSGSSKLGKTKILAPMAGIVLKRSVEPGQTVTGAGYSATPVLFTLAEDLTKLGLHVHVAEADVSRVREGMDASFTVDAYPGRKFSSRVLSLHNDPTTEQNVVTYEAVLAVDNADRALRPGMTATVSIVSETIANALVVPNAALRFAPPAPAVPNAGLGVAPPPAAAPRSDEKRVYTLRGVALSPIGVKTGATDGNVTELLDGPLTVGTEVVVDVVAPQ